jgi:predicted dehydrogenase
MAEPLRVAVVGCGGIGKTHLDRWRKIETAQLVGVSDVDEERARATGLPAFTEHERLLDEVRPEAVDICTPPAFHAPVALAAIERGIPVISEKPLARNPDEARGMVEAARSRGVPLMTAFCHRFHEPNMLAAQLIREGRLGRIVQFRNRFGARLVRIADIWSSKAEIAGGGVLIDTSIHSVDLFRFFLGEVRQVLALCQTFNPNLKGVEDTAMMLLEAESGAQGVIESSWNTPWSRNTVELYGEGGAAIVDYDAGELRYRLEGDADWQRPELGKMDRFERELRHFVRAVRGEEPLQVTGEDGLRAVEIVYQAYGR